MSIERQERLKKMLKEIVIQENPDKSIRVKKVGGDVIDISLDYDFKQFNFKPGDFMNSFLGLSLCVGVNKNAYECSCGECPRMEEKTELFFLHESFSGVSSINGKIRKALLI